MNAESSHFHWIFYQYGARTSDGNFSDSTTIDIVAYDYREAEAKVEALYPLSFKGTPTSGRGRFLRELVEHLPGACNSGHH